MRTLLVGFMTFTATTASAEDTSVCFEEWEPFTFVEDGEPKGLYVDLFREGMETLGYTVSFSEQPYRRCARAVATGKMDAILLSSGESDMVPSEASAVFWQVGIIARPDFEPQTFTTLSDFDTARTGLVSGYDYESIVGNDIANWNAEWVATAILNLRKVNTGRIDLTIVDVPWAEINAKKENLTFTILSPLVGAFPQVTYFSNARADLAPLWTSELNAMIADGRVDAVYKSYTGVSFDAVNERNEKTLY